MLYDFQAGASPPLVNVPHAGTDLPPEVVARLIIEAGALPDTDWHVHRLADSAARMGGSALNRLLAGKPA